MSAKKSLENYYRRQLKERERSRRPPRKNAKPEAEVKAEVLRWLKAKGFAVHAVESKAVYSVRAGRYINSQAVPGFSDLVGASPDGRAVFIELKAPGRRSTLRPGQRAFLIEKIGIGAFACVVDSVEYLADVWREFEHRRRMDPQLAKVFLSRALPQMNTVQKSLDIDFN